MQSKRDELPDEPDAGPEPIDASTGHEAEFATHDSEVADSETPPGPPVASEKVAERFQPKLDAGSTGATNDIVSSADEGANAASISDEQTLPAADESSAEPGLFSSIQTSAVEIPPRTHALEQFDAGPEANPNFGLVAATVASPQIPDPMPSEETRRAAPLRFDPIAPATIPRLAPTSDGGPALARPIVLVRLAAEEVRAIVEQALAAARDRDTKTLDEIAEAKVNFAFWSYKCEQRAANRTWR